MPIRTRRIQVTRQQKHILLLALFLIKHQHGGARPSKQQVLNFIDLHCLIAIRAEDRKTVTTGEEAWANSIAWRRADLVKESCVAMPKRGEWQITPTGEKRIIEWCATIDAFATRKADWENNLRAFESIFMETVVITRETVVAARHANEIARRIFPNCSPQISPGIEGKLEL